MNCKKKIILKKKTCHFFKIPFSKFSIHTINVYTKPFIHFFFREEERGWWNVLTDLFPLFTRFGRIWPGNSPLFSVSVWRSQQQCWPNRLETAYLIPIEPRRLGTSMLSSHLSISKITTILELSLSMWRIKVFLRPWISIGCWAEIQSTYVKSFVCLNVYRNY